MRTVNTLTSFAIAGLVSCAAQAQTSAPLIPEPPAIAAKSYVLMDYASGQVLVSENADQKLPPASLTKMMTSYILGQALEEGKVKRDDLVTISEAAWAQNFPGSSVMFLEVGKQVSIDDLNRGIIIQSGNDATVAVAEHLAGSVNSFADLMNSWAARLGMKDSHFVTPHGLHSDDMYTTAYDMALLGQALIRDVPEEYAIYAEKTFTYNGITQNNRNSLLWDQSLNVDGIKTGHVEAVGYNLVSSATKEDMRLIAVVMGATNERARAAESKKLLTYGFRFYQTLTPYEAGSKLVDQKIWMGDKSTVALGVDKPVAVTIPRGQAQNLQADFTLDQALKAPLAKGQQVGTVHLRLNDKEVATVPLVALEDIEQGGLFSRLIDYLTLLVQGLFD
ncbi:MULTISPECIES: D-alanyl-D-alanine carboxypeptidase family protein [Oceanimonas]|uniref:serine-type D-Ala-D-Ala carboxypeptidase n=1 Tax=Oceanimonas doudoroffii TaxID=84158 RepID=A0A233RBK7_9GAMM|nr:MULTISPECIES: D-alanyl-D-alanine carboxypeptidase family protein [Oceanimonas]NHI02171.1 D-alanyl-D-alanine carboxypeptidase DacA [Oceanimonas sp. MB9]OXY80769.1 D-alanyl-D-alanine carboxypeptidase [Oceanimonas doudoroffii]